MDNEYTGMYMCTIKSQEQQQHFVRKRSRWRKKQQELGNDSLEEGDKYLMEINLEDLENTSVKKK